MSLSTEPGNTSPSAWWRDRSRVPLPPRRDLVACGALATLVVLLFHECVLFGRVLYEWDIHLLWYSQAEGFVRAVASGSLPLWNPDVAFGRPMLADANYQVVYPPAWLHLLLEPRLVHVTLLVCHAVFSGVGLFLMARSLGCSRLAAVTGAGLWLSSGPLLSLVYVWNHFSAACWIPWALLAATRVRAQGGAVARISWGASLAAPVLAGSPDVAAYLALASACYVLGDADWRRPASERSPRALKSLVVAGTLALGLAAAQCLPSLDLARRSERAALTAEVQTYWSLHPLVLAQLIAPVTPNNLPLQLPLRASLFESRDPFLQSVYLGLPGLGLVLAALAGPGSRARRVFGLLCAAFVLLALGRFAPIHAVLSALLFPLRMLRYPQKAMVMAAFFWCLLAALGLDEWRRHAAQWPRPRRLLVLAALGVPSLVALGGALALWAGRAWVAERCLLPGVAPELLRPLALQLGWAAAMGALAVALALAAHRSRGGASAQALGLGLALLAVADPAVANRALNPAGPKEIFTSRPPLAGLKVAGEATRVYVHDYLVSGKSQAYLGRPNPYQIARVPPGWNADETLALAMRQMLFPPTAQAWGLEGSYDADVQGLYPQWLSGLVAFLRSQELGPNHLRLLRMAGVQHVIALHERGFEQLAKEADLPSWFPESVRVFRVPEPLPRCYAVSGARVADGARALAVLSDPSFAPEREVLLSQGEPAAERSGFSGSARLVERRPDRVRMEATLNAPGYVVLLDGYDVGWQASVDGREVRTLRANVAFRAVAVAAGQHLIEQRYRPPAPAKSGLSFQQARAAAKAQADA